MLLLLLPRRGGRGGPSVAWRRRQAKLSRATGCLLGPPLSPAGTPLAPFPVLPRDVDGDGLAFLERADEPLRVGNVDQRLARGELALDLLLPLEVLQGYIKVEGFVSITESDADEGMSALVLDSEHKISRRVDRCPPKTRQTSEGKKESLIQKIYDQTFFYGPFLHRTDGVDSVIVLRIVEDNEAFSSLRDDFQSPNTDFLGPFTPSTHARMIGRGLNLLDRHDSYL